MALFRQGIQITGRSVQTTSALSQITCTIDTDGRLLLTLSDGLNQSTGMTRSTPIIGSALFDSETRLLEFNLTDEKSMNPGKAFYDRLIKNATNGLAHEWLRTEFLLSVPSAHSARIHAALKQHIDPNSELNPSSFLPKLEMHNLNAFSWPRSLGEGRELENCEILEVFEWTGLVGNPRLLERFNEPKKTSLLYYNEAMYTEKVTAHLFTLNGPLLPPSSNILSALQSSLFSASSIISGRTCATLPPSLELNRLRQAHFNPKKFDPSLSVVEDSLFVAINTPGNELFGFHCNRSS